MKIICFGDSITRGVTCIRGRLRILKDNYPAALQSCFKHSSDTEIVNKGVFNDNSDLLVKRLQKDVIQEKPDAVLICIGGNDCNFKWDEVAKHPEEAHIPIVPPDRYIANLKHIVGEIKEKGITPILLTLPPLDPKRYYQSISARFGKSISHWIGLTGGIEHWHGNYNRRLKSLIQQLNVSSIDVRSAIKKAGDLKDLISDDGIHLTAKGYNVMGRKIFKELSAIQLPGRSLTHP
ncbi:SGNH/GDSL hydrolase family protein [Heyndrickxia acidiproducens]|uniref:SGNH/GDSL hydrolase family protein n=1 Tax=Heyndrickxia acidiproducens TaxID=1121084 RepID=UPI0003657A88|nr:GDSL-type esterase/lipase family protein [Heyndrickxia acidiproducens]